MQRYIMKKSPEINGSKKAIEDEINHSVLSTDAKRALLIELENKRTDELPAFNKKIQRITSEALDDEFEERSEKPLNLPQVPTHPIRENDIAIKLRAVDAALNDAKKHYNEFCKSTETRILDIRIKNAPIQMALKQQLDLLETTRNTIFKIYNGLHEKTLTSTQKAYFFNRVENFKANVTGFNIETKKQIDTYWNRRDRDFQLEKRAQEIIHASMDPINNRASDSERNLAAARDLMTRYKSDHGNTDNKSANTDTPPNNNPSYKK